MRITESDITRLVKRILLEGVEDEISIWKKILRDGKYKDKVLFIDVETAIFLYNKEFSIIVDDGYEYEYIYFGDYDEDAMKRFAYELSHNHSFGIDFDDYFASVAYENLYELTKNEDYLKIKEIAKDDMKLAYQLAKGQNLI